MYVSNSFKFIELKSNLDLFPLREDLDVSLSLVISENLFMLKTNNEAKPVHNISQIETLIVSSMLLTTIIAPPYTLSM